jgi:hypothetical protein
VLRSRSHAWRPAVTTGVNGRPLSESAVGRFLVPIRSPERLLYAEALRRCMRNLTVDGLSDDEVCIGDRYRASPSL